MRVLGTNTEGELLLEATYENNADCGDSFNVSVNVILEIPDNLQTAMQADIVVSNGSGYAVIPEWQPHRLFSEQWELFSISSMYVADNLTVGLPSWYNTLDSPHSYVGLTGDNSYLNDGYSVNFQTYVSTHDTKFIVASNTTVTLDHDTGVCPYIVIADYEWYDQLVMQDVDSTEICTQHAYDSTRNHCVEILGCSGLTANTHDLRWSATYNRNDSNMVDGDNIQIKLGMDDYLNEWPTDRVQTLSLRLVTGNTRPKITQFNVDPAGQVSLSWTTEPGESYTLKHTTTFGGTWTNIATGVTNSPLGPLSAPLGFFRIEEE